MDIDILLALQDGIPIVKEPFATVAQQLGIKPDEVTKRLRRLRKEKIIRKFGTFTWKRKAGIRANAMVVWAVPSNRIQEVADVILKFEQVTHCYARRPVPNKWRYTLYTVIHGFERRTVREFVKTLAEKVGVEDYAILFSVKEFARRSSGRLKSSDRRLLTNTLDTTN